MPQFDPSRRQRRRGLHPVPDGDESTEAILVRVGRGDQEAFALLYDRCAGPVYGLVRRVLRDPAQAEEVTQEVLLDVWRSSARYDPQRGQALSWILTLAHRRAVDRVRSEQSARLRDDLVGRRDGAPAHDQVAEQVEVNLEHQQVRQALSSLTALQREAVELAYYRGYTYRQVAELLETPLGTVKTRLRDGLIRLRDALAVVT